MRAEPVLDSTRGPALPYPAGMRNSTILIPLLMILANDIRCKDDAPAGSEFGEPCGGEIKTPCQDGLKCLIGYCEEECMDASDCQPVEGNQRECPPDQRAQQQQSQRADHARIADRDFEIRGRSFAERPRQAWQQRPLWQRLLQTRRPLTLEGLQRERRLVPAVDTATLETLDVLARALGELQAGAVLGLFAGGRGRSEDSADPAESLGEGDAALPEGLLGLLCVKDERVSDAYTLEELELLAGVAAQLCITLQNSKLYERMKERDRLAALGQMAAGVSHDLKNILNPLALHLQFLKRSLPRDATDAQESVAEMQQVLKRGIETVERLRDFSRQSPQRKVEPVDLNLLVHEAVEICKPRLHSRSEVQIRIVTTLGAPGPVLLQASDGVAALVNLIVNAIDALHDKGTITVSTGGPLGADTDAAGSGVMVRRKSCSGVSVSSVPCSLSPTLSAPRLCGCPPFPSGMAHTT